MRFREVQSVEHDSPPVVEEWLFLRVSPRCCAAFLLLPELAPLPKHLKRVRKRDDELHVLLGPPSSPLSPLWPALAASSSGLFPVPVPELARVPVTAPRTREQFLFLSSLWPCQFVEPVLATPPISPETKEAFSHYLQLAGKEGCVVVDWAERRVVCRIESGASSLSSRPFDRHVAMLAVREAGRQIEDRRRQLLCTGYFVFVGHEPCVMCAMALVHARVAAVVIGAKCLETGALTGDTLRIGSHPKLNHRYAVYCVEHDE